MPAACGETKSSLRCGPRVYVTTEARQHCGGTILNPQDRNQFLNFSGSVLGGLALAALGLGWAVEIDPLQTLSWDWVAVLWGLAGTVPLFALFALLYWLPIGPLRTIRKFLAAELAPSLAVLTWFDLVFLALLTGVAEELFFRGMLEPWIGWFWSNLLFGMAHLVTPTYGVLTFLVGLYLSWLKTCASPANLLIPIVTHAVYDYGGFLVIIWRHRQEMTKEVSNFKSQ